MGDKHTNDELVSSDERSDWGHSALDGVLEVIGWILEVLFSAFLAFLPEVA